MILKRGSLMLVLGLLSLSSLLHASTVLRARAINLLTQEPINSAAYLNGDHLRVECGDKTSANVVLYQRNGQLWLLTPDAPSTSDHSQVSSPAVVIEPVLFVKKGGGVPIEGRRCNFYTGFRDDKKVIDIWTVDRKQLNLEADEFTLLQALQKFGSGELAPAGDIFLAGSRDWEQNSGYSGVPVRMIRYNDDGLALQTITLANAEPVETSTDIFELPSGFHGQARFK